jgi:hypothetical protein
MLFQMMVDLGFCWPAALLPIPSALSCSWDKKKSLYSEVMIYFMNYMITVVRISNKVTRCWWVFLLLTILLLFLLVLLMLPIFHFSGGPFMLIMIMYLCLLVEQLGSSQITNSQVFTNKPAHDSSLESFHSRQDKMHAGPVRCPINKTLVGPVHNILIVISLLPTSLLFVRLGRGIVTVIETLI